MLGSLLLEAQSPGHWVICGEVGEVSISRTIVRRGETRTWTGAVVATFRFTHMARAHVGIILGEIDQFDDLPEVRGGSYGRGPRQEAFLSKFGEVASMHPDVKSALLSSPLASLLDVRPDEPEYDLPRIDLEKVSAEAFEDAERKLRRQVRRILRLMKPEGPVVWYDRDNVEDRDPVRMLDDEAVF